MNAIEMLDLIYGVDTAVLESTISVCNEIDSLSRKKYIMENYSYNDTMFIETFEEVSDSVFQESFSPINKLDTQSIELSDYEKWLYDFKSEYHGTPAPLTSTAKVNRCLAELAVMAYNSNIRAKKEEGKSAYGAEIEVSKFRYVNGDALRAKAGYNEKSMALFIMLKFVKHYGPKQFIFKYYTAFPGEITSKYGGKEHSDLGAVTFAFTLPEQDKIISKALYKKKVAVDSLERIRFNCKKTGTDPTTDPEYIKLNNWITASKNTTEESIKREWDEAVKAQAESARTNSSLFGWHVTFPKDEKQEKKTEERDKYNKFVIAFIKKYTTAPYTGDLPNIQMTIDKIATYFNLK